MKQKVKKRKINKTKLWAIIVSSIAVLAFICMLVGVGIIASLLKDKPTLNIQDFEQTESSIVYDVEGNEIANLGKVIRTNVEYDELPNCVVDAFVAIEDSRFFEHNGFDLPRFTKAIIENLRTFSFGQGGSTFTMQLVKNTYFTSDETGEEASRSGVSGIRRKVQEIALALELEKYESKQFIFESYLNKLNYGGSRNIRGIQKAAQYYFGKDVSELNVNEAAFLAGVINAPYYYSPFTQDSDGIYHIEEAQEREEEVLYQMYNHGYLSKTEYDLAKSVQIKDLLKDPTSSNTEGEGVPYQAYIDTVVQEVMDITGLDPYTNTMHIYTYMNADIQNVMDEIQASGKDDYVGFPDEYMEAASVCIDNSTGQVVAILGGRNYSKGGQLLLNHATEQHKQPGSSIKPILDYCLAFEYLGWATDHVISDVPMYMDSSKLNLVYNYSGTYVGDVTLYEAVGESINTCAIQTLQQVIDKIKYEKILDYTQSLGYDFTLEKFNDQYGVGGSTCEVTPYQHAAAYAAIFNNGIYNTPHTVSRIEFTNGKSPITPVYEPKQVVSEQAAYLTTELMKNDVAHYGGSYTYVRSSDYTVYGKTGTTDWGTEGEQFGIPSGSNKDAWIVASTSEYTTVTWVGYEKAVIGQQSYITNDCYYNIRPQARIAHTILDACYEYGDSKPTQVTKPSGISSITHIIGTFPYASPNVDGVTVDPSFISTGLIKSDSAKLVTLTAPAIEELKEADATLGANGNTVILKWKEYPGQIKIDGENKVRDTSLVSATGEVIIPATGKVLFDPSWIYGEVKYCADIKIGNKVTTVSTIDNSKEFAIEAKPGDKISVVLYYGFDNSTSTSNKITKDCGVASTSITFPSSGDEESLKAFANEYSGIVTFKKGEPKDDAASFTVISSKDSGTNLAGKAVTVKDDTTYTITYYPAIDYSITIAQKDKTDGSIVLAASSKDTTFTWGYQELTGWTYVENANELTISIDKATAEIFEQTITVSNSKGKQDSYTVAFQAPSN